jgi:uncharacterized protein YpbB
MIKIYLIGSQYVNALICALEESESHLLLKISEMQRWREELLNSKLKHIKGNITLRKIITLKNVSEQRNLDKLVID